MAKSKKSSKPKPTKADELKAATKQQAKTILLLEKRIEKLEASAERHKADLKKAKAVAKEAQRDAAAEVEKVKSKAAKKLAALEGKLARATRSVRTGPDSPVEVVDVDPVEEVVEAPAPAAEGPDESWTVTRMRAAAREQGVAGYSRKTKAQLLAELS